MASRIALPILACLLATVLAQAPSTALFENEIQGKPEIECGHGTINFKVDTKQKAPARIYVKGNSDREECVFHGTANASIPLNKCNMRRKREISPSGIAYDFTIVVQLHELFITKVDRAYNVNCFYMETQKDISAELGVSDPGTQTISGTPSMPECVYTIHKDSPNGAVVRHAKVGDTLFHIWDCPSDLYAMKLHSCDVSDGSGGKFRTIDTDGCAVDEYIMPTVTYNAETTRAMVASPAFNFPDKNSMIFSCQIQLCFKGEDCSQITPPSCGADKNVISPNQNSLSEELDDEQLIPSSSSTLPPTTTTTTPAPTTPLEVFLSSSSKRPIEEMPFDFPRPNVLPSADVEGSGEEDLEITTTTAATIKLLKKTNRSQRHSPPRPRSLVNFDIQSPELTIMDNNLDPDMSEPAAQKTFIGEFESANTEHNHNSSEMPQRVCLPVYSFYAGIALILLVAVVVFIVVMKSRKSFAVHKFNY
uniref:ZP domain-containing protein n=1 Tax=Panagrellus redivivus TaxID=6233 RepID=A0A7E4VYB8_PANRE